MLSKICIMAKQKWLAKAWANLEKLCYLICTGETSHKIFGTDSWMQCSSIMKKFVRLFQNLTASANCTFWTLVIFCFMLIWLFTIFRVLLKCGLVFANSKWHLPIQTGICQFRLVLDKLSLIFAKICMQILLQLAIWTGKCQFSLTETNSD